MRPLLFFILFVACSQNSVLAQRVGIIEVRAGNHASHPAPLRAQLPKPLKGSQQWLLVDLNNGNKIPAQLLDSITLIFIPTDSIPAGSTVRYEIRKANPTAGEPPVTIRKEKGGLLVSVGTRPVFFYHILESLPPADSPAYYSRSGFIHPLYSPNGKILTDDFPLGHIHQHAIFMAWVNTTFRNEFMDFWNQHLQKGTVEHVDVLAIREGPVCAQLTVSLRYKSFKFGEVLKEIWRITIYPYSEHFLFDLESEQVNTTNDTLFLNQYHYGGLAFRGSREWNPDDKFHFQKNWHILTSEGIRDTLANHTKARWVDAWGEIDGGIVGTDVLAHPSDYRYPQAIRVHPTMPYWCYAPVIDGAFWLAPGEPYRSRYRYFVHRGAPDISVIEKLNDDWVNPPSVRVLIP